MSEQLDIYQLSKQLGLRQEHDYRWSGIYTTGLFDALFDYDAGILQVNISATIASIKGEERLFNVMFGISTVDDGGWQALDIKCDYTEDEAKVRINEIAKEFMEFMGRSTKLPREQLLNDFLMTLGLWGEYTG